MDALDTDWETVSQQCEEPNGTAPSEQLQQHRCSEPHSLPAESAELTTAMDRLSLGRQEGMEELVSGSCCTLRQALDTALWDQSATIDLLSPPALADNADVDADVAAGEAAGGDEVEREDDDCKREPK